MPVDPEVLKQAIQEASGGDAELAEMLAKKAAANDTVATAFLGGFMRNRDYTQKSQVLADDRRTMENQVEQYRGLLESAETEKAKVLKDLASHKVSLSAAYQQIKNIKDTYALSDDDVPGYRDLIATQTKEKPVDSSAGALDERFAAFEKKITNMISQTLIPELGGMARLDIVWSDIRDEHSELTGKRLSAREQQELLNEADRRSKAGRPISLKDLWEEKYDVPQMRQKYHDDTLAKELRSKWDAEQQAKISEAALAGVHPVTSEQQGIRTSQILNHKFKVHEDAPAVAGQAKEQPSANQRQALTGAERAGQRFLERRASGVPMGAPDERKAGGGKAA